MESKALAWQIGVQNFANCPNFSFGILSMSTTNYADKRIGKLESKTEALGIRMASKAEALDRHPNLND
jgi:hypothetical protein